MKHVAVVITARASLARVQTVLESIPPIKHRLSIVLAGSAALAKYGDVEADLAELRHGNIYRCTAFEPHGKDGAAAYTGHLTTELAQLFRLIKPTDVVVIADRYETLAVSIAASYQNIRLIHLLGGERSGNIDDKVRFANTALADVHCVPHVEAERLLIGAARGEVHLTGCPSVDLAFRAEMPSGQYLLEHGAGPQYWSDHDYAVVLYHPGEGDVLTALDLFEAVDAARKACLKAVYWFWPNIDPGAEAIEREIRSRIDNDEAGFRFYRHMPAHLFLGLVKNAAVLIGNSSVGVREAGVFGTPVVNIGHRQDGRLKTRNVRHWSDCCVNTLESAIRAQIKHGRYEPDFTYGDGQAGARIAKIILEEA